MASGAAAPVLSEDGMRALWEAASTGPLPGIYLVRPSRPDGVGQRALSYLAKLRPGGFMVALPDIEEVVQSVRDLEDEVNEAFVAVYPSEVELETVRGRRLGLGSCILADFSWSLVGHPLRSASAFEVLRFALEGTACRPRRSSVAAAADAWIHEVMDDDTAADYVTGESEHQPAAGEELELDANGGGEDEVSELRRRIAELELARQLPRDSQPFVPRA